MVIGEKSPQRLFKLGGLLTCSTLGQLGQRARIALSGDQGFHHRSGGDSVQFREHRRDLDLGVLEEFFDALLFTGAVLHQRTAVAGEVTQSTDLGWVH